MVNPSFDPSHPESWDLIPDHGPVIPDLIGNPWASYTVTLIRLIDAVLLVYLWR